METEIFVRSMPSKSASMSCRVSIATPSRPTSPSDISWSESYPIRVGMSKSTERPVCPWAMRNWNRRLVSAPVPKPAICRIVHVRPRYMVGYGPRVKGYRPGSPTSSHAVAARSAGV